MSIAKSHNQLRELFNDTSVSISESEGCNYFTYYGLWLL